MPDTPQAEIESARALVRFVEKEGVAHLRLDAGGSVVRLGNDRRVDFTFEYRGFRFAMRARPATGGVLVQVNADLGNLPYSIEGPDQRANALAIVEAAAAALGGRLIVTAGQRVLMKEEYTVAGPFQIDTVLARIVELLVNAKPYLSLLAVVVRPPAFPAAAAE